MGLGFRVQGPSDVLGDPLDNLGTLCGPLNGTLGPFRVSSRGERQAFQAQKIAREGWPKGREGKGREGKGIYRVARG